MKRKSEKEKKRSCVAINWKQTVGRRDGPGSSSVNQTLTIRGIKFRRSVDRSLGCIWLACTIGKAVSVRVPGNDDSAVTRRGLAAATVAAFLLGFPAGLCASISERARAPLHNLLTVTARHERERGRWSGRWRTREPRVLVKRRSAEQEGRRETEWNEKKKRETFYRRRISRTIHPATTAAPSRCIVFLCLFRPSHRLRDGMNWEKGDPRGERRISSRSLVFWLRREVRVRASLAFGLGRDENATVKSWNNFLETFLLDNTYLQVLQIVQKYLHSCQFKYF